MTTEELTQEERGLKTLFLVWTWVFGAGGLVFLFGSRPLFFLANTLSQEILGPEWPVMPVPDQHFWLTLTFAMMLMLTMISWRIQQDVRSSQALIQVILASKLASTLIFMAFFFTDGPYLLYLLGAVGCDGPIFLITLIFYRRARRSGCFGMDETNEHQED